MSYPSSPKVRGSHVRDDVSEFAFPFLIKIQGYLISPLFLLDPSRFRIQRHRKLLHDQRIYIESQRLNLLHGLQDSILFNA